MQPDSSVSHRYACYQITLNLHVTKSLMSAYIDTFWHLLAWQELQEQSRVQRQELDRLRELWDREQGDGDTAALRRTIDVSA